MNAKSKEIRGMSDAQLVQCYMGGNNNCFTEIVERHHPHVHRLVHYKLHNAAWEKDAEQETFIVASTEIRSGHYHDTGHLGSYLNTIAYNEAMQIFRRENHYVHDDTALRSDEQTESAEETFYERNANTALLRFAMKKLSAHYRDVLELRNVDEMSFKEIGLQLNISEASACALYGKAKSRIKVVMKNITNERRLGSGRRSRT